MTKTNNTNIMFQGLRRRPTYDELVGEVDKPIFDKYPDRKAYKLRSSNWLSQLDGDTSQIIETQNHNLMKEKEKEHLLNAYASSTNVPIYHARAMHSQSAAAARQQEDDDILSSLLSPDRPRTEWGTPERQATPDEARRQLSYQDVSPQEIPSQSQLTHYHHSVVPAPMTQSETISRNKFKVQSKKKPQPTTKTKFFDMTEDDLDEEVQHQHEMNVDDAEMKYLESTVKLQTMLMETQQMLQSTSTAVDDKMQTSTASSSSQKNKAETSSPAPRPKSKAKPEPKGESASSSTKPAKTKTSKPTAKAKKVPHDDAKDQEPESTTIPIKKPIKSIAIEKVIPKVVHGTQIEKFGSFDEWMTKKNRGFLIDQLDLRKVKLNKTDRKRMSIKNMIDKLLEHDNI